MKLNDPHHWWTEISLDSFQRHRNIIRRREKLLNNTNFKNCWNKKLETLNCLQIFNAVAGVKWDSYTVKVQQDFHFFLPLDIFGLLWIFLPSSQFNKWQWKKNFETSDFSRSNASERFRFAVINWLKVFHALLADGMNNFCLSRSFSVISQKEVRNLQT